MSTTASAAPAGQRPTSSAAIDFACHEFWRESYTQAVSPRQRSARPSGSNKIHGRIRHGIARHPDAGDLRITARRDGGTLEVSVGDDGVGIGDAVMPQGHGIDDTREQLRSLYGGRASLTVNPRADGGTVAILRLAYREMVLE